MIIFGFSQGFLSQHSAMAVNGSGLTENKSPPSFSSSSSPVMKDNKESKENRNENKDDESKKSVMYYIPIYVSLRFSTGNKSWENLIFVRNVCPVYILFICLFFCRKLFRLFAYRKIWEIDQHGKQFIYSGLIMKSQQNRHLLFDQMKRFFCHAFGHVALYHVEKMFKNNYEKQKSQNQKPLFTISE